MTENKLFKILDKQFVWREKEILDYFISENHFLKNMYQNQL